MKEAFLIEGKKPLSGEVVISGSKNAALCLIPASLLSRGKVVLNNVPDIQDVRIMLQICEKLNVKCQYNDHQLIIDSSNLKYTSLCIDEMVSLRASYYFYGLLIGRFKHLDAYAPGGCKIGESRPIDLHIYALNQFGVVSFADNSYHFTSEKLISNEIEFSKTSLGATVNAILIACQIKGLSIIKNASLEPEVIELINFINKMGGNITYEDHTIKIMGQRKYHGIEYEVIPDRIEAGTFLLLGASLGNNLKISHINLEHVQSLLSIFDQLMIPYQTEENAVTISKVEINYSVKVNTGPYPMFPSDLQPLLTAYFTTIKRISIIEEDVYNRRFKHINELRKMGANILVLNHNIMVNGIFNLRGATVTGSDLRSTAALILASLNAEGTSKVYGLSYFYRGYENFVEKIKKIGGSIQKIEVLNEVG